MIKPFHIDVPLTALNDLDDRLQGTRWTDELTGAGWERGVPVSYLKETVAYWANTFDWRAQEALVNEHPQFTTEVDGQNVHFLHVRSAHEDAIPLLLIHGWPGSVFDFIDMIKPLTDPEDGRPAFHLVIPSVPGFGFSGPITEPGWTDSRVAAALAEVMARLGYDRYGVQGGDIGAFIGPALGRIDSAHVIGVHANALVTFPTGDPSALPEAEQARFKAMKAFQDDMSAYMQLKGTRPQTIAHALADSPAGQLAWIAEKYKEWTDPSKDLPEAAVNLDRLLATVSVYWFTDTARSVANSYYERFHDASMWAPKPPATVPTGVAVFAAGDYAIRTFAENAHNIVHWSEFTSGGHFPALEVPELLVADVRTFFASL